MAASLGGQLTPGRVLALILICFTLLAGAVLALTPPWEANDEPDHVRNVEVLTSGHWYRITADSGFESHQAPLYYLTLAAFQKLTRLPVEMPDGVLGPVGGGQLRGNYAHDVPQDGSDQRRLDLLRLPSIVFGLLAICLTYVAARRVSSDRWTPVVAAALVAGVPKFVFLSAVINNDNLSNFLGAACLAAALALLMAPLDTQRGRLLGAAGVGLLVGMLILTKVTNALIAPGLLVAVMLVGRDRRERLELVAAFLATALVVSGWWFVQNQSRYGDPFAARAAKDHLKALFPPLFEIAGPVERIFVQIPKGIYKSLWYESGYNQFSWRWFWYLPFWLGAAAGVAGLLWGRRVRPTSKQALWVLSLVAIGALAIVWILGLQTSTEQARVAFVGLPAVAIILALGYERLGLPPAWRFLLPVIGLIGTVAAIRYNVVIPYS
jgi:4-amino-4-deoxy-L-arabinose transferase-like glycosyltransferase